MDSDRNAPLTNNSYPSNLLFIPQISHRKTKAGIIPPITKATTLIQDTTLTTTPTQVTITLHLHQTTKVKSDPTLGYNNMPPPNYGGQQPYVPGQQAMPNLNQGKFFFKKKIK